MLGMDSDLASVFGVAPSGDAGVAELHSYAKALCGVGMHVLLLFPGTKEPVDIRTSIQRSKDDKAAKEVARLAGNPRWNSVRSKSGVHLATDNPALLCRHITNYRKQFGEDAHINFAISVGPSGLVVVDCDTKDQVRSFLSDFGVDVNTPPTVLTPGVERGGEWLHKDGGHFYFRRGDAELPSGTGTFVSESHWAAFWDGRYVLIPPSKRPEGLYRFTGAGIWDVPPAIVEVVGRHARIRLERGAGQVRDAGFDENIAAWSQATSWSDILGPAGWTEAARPDSCGCPTWTAPGDHGSPKSATGHEPGCSEPRYDPVNPPLHVWTDHPGEELEGWIREQQTSTVSKLRVFALLHAGGDMGQVIAAYGLSPDLNLDVEIAAAVGGDVRSLAAEFMAGDLSAPMASHQEVMGIVAASAPVSPPVVDPFADPVSSPANVVDVDLFSDPVSNDVDSAPVDPVSFTQVVGDSEDNDDDESRVPGVPTIRPFNYWRDFPAPSFMIEGLLEQGGFASIIGAPGVGKSAVALDMACSLVTGKPWQGRATIRQRVLYLPGEGLSGAVQRIQAWEAAHDASVGEDLFVGDSVIQISASRDAWAQVMKTVVDNDIGVIIFDTFARSAVGLEENSAKDVGLAVARFDHVREATKAAVIVVHHTGKGSESGRGSSALNGAVDSELLVRHRDSEEGDAVGVSIAVLATKQKNAEQMQPIPLLLSPQEGSIVVTGPSGVVDDPLSAVAPVVPKPEAVIETVERIWMALERFPEQGLSKVELRGAVPVDEGRRHRADAGRAWALQITEAIDLALKYGLIETLTGRATGARYIRGVTGISVARDAYFADRASIE